MRQPIGLVLLVLGVLLANRVEPGVIVESFTALGTLLLTLGALLGNDLGMAVFLGYALGQWIPRVL